MASKILTYEEINLSEEELENNLIFEGFIFFENPLKNETKESIQKLKNAYVDNVMITGDNLLTALNVAYNSTLISNTKNIWLGE